MERRSFFPGRALPLLLVAPQLAITAIFFLWPAFGAALASLHQEDPFGFSARFVGLGNFAALFADPLYLAAILRTLVFCAAVCLGAIGLALPLAVLTHGLARGRAFYRVLFAWPYAVAPVVAGVVWILILHPQIGWLSGALETAGIDWDYKLNGTQAMLAVILAASWKQVAYNFILLAAALHAIPPSILDAARLDGAGPWQIFRAVLLPLLMPTIGFLAVVNVAYAAFDTFGTIEALTRGGPGQATQTLVVKIYRDGMLNLDLGSSSAQSLVLMVLVVALVGFQLRLTGRGSGA